MTLEELKEIMVADADKNTNGIGLDSSFFENPFNNKYIDMKKVRDDLHVNKYLTVAELFDAFCIATARDIQCEYKGMKPAMRLSLIDGIYFCNWLNEVAGLPPVYILTMYKNEYWIWENPQTMNGPRPFRLMTQDDYKAATHEINPNTGQPYIYAGSDNADEVAWHSGNSGGQPHDVGMLKPNGFGIYDLSGLAGELVFQQRPPYMTEEIWPTYFPGKKYLDFKPY